MTRPPPRQTMGVAMIVTAAALFALNGTASKLLLQGGFDALQLTAFRAASGFVGLLVLNLLVGPGPQKRPTSWREMPRLIGFGLTGFFLVPVLYYVAIHRLPVGIGLLFEFTAPVFVALWVRFGERQPVKPRLWAGLALCLVGLVSVAQIWAGEIRLDLLGMAAGLASAVLLAVYYVLGSKSVAERDPLSLTCWAIGISAVAGAVVRPWWNFPFSLLAASSDGVPMWLLAGYLVVLGTIVPYLLVSASMRHLPPTSVGIVSMTELALAALFAWLLLSEVLSTPQILGGLLVLSGVILAETARANASSGTRTPEIPPT